MEPILAANLLAPNFGLAIWIAITFVALLVVLRRFAWGPITSALAAREVRLRESLQQAEKALAEATDIQAENERARREADAEAQHLLRQSRDAAEALRAEELEKTRAQIRQMQEAAQSEIERERDGALQYLRKEVADLAIQAAERVLDANLDDERQRKLVDDFLGGLPKN